MDWHSASFSSIDTIVLSYAAEAREFKTTFPRLLCSSAARALDENEALDTTRLSERFLRRQTLNGGHLLAAGTFSVGSSHGNLGGLCNSIPRLTIRLEVPQCQGTLLSPKGSHSETLLKGNGLVMEPDPWPSGVRGIGSHLASQSVVSFRSPLLAAQPGAHFPGPPSQWPCENLLPRLTVSVSSNSIRRCRGV